MWEQAALSCVFPQPERGSIVDLTIAASIPMQISKETPIVKPGRNAWRSAIAEKVAFLVDAADYFKRLDQVLDLAQKSIFTRICSELGNWCYFFSLYCALCFKINL